MPIQHLISFSAAVLEDWQSGRGMSAFSCRSQSLTLHDRSDMFQKSVRWRKKLHADIGLVRL